MESSLYEYLESVGIVDGVQTHNIVCEVCGGSEYQTLVDEVETGQGNFHRLPVVTCTRCGYLYQNPRFNKEFYDAYYNKYYRLMLFGNTQPERDFLVDQIRRGEYLYQNLKVYLPETGNLLDVGCSAGGLMVAFAKRVWNVLGTDPDSGYANFGKEKFDFAIDPIAAEDMQLPANYFDLIIITGSLEHVFDVNHVLKICKDACKKDALILIEGRALGYGIQQGYFSHNHRRYLSLRSIELLMLKHGWTPILSTSEALSGPTRPGGVYVLGRADQPLDMAELSKHIDAESSNLISDLRQQLKGLRGAV